MASIPKLVPPVPKVTFFAPDWYWIVGGDQTRAFSSKTGDYVSTSDPVYVAWRAKNEPRRAATISDVAAQLQKAPVDPAALDAYKSLQTNDAVKQVLFNLMFNHENRIRALEGKQPITKAQAAAALKVLL